MASDPITAGYAREDILKMLGIGLAGGMTARGLLGLRDLFGHPDAHPQRYLGPTQVTLPFPVYTRKRDEERAQELTKLSSVKKAEEPLGNSKGDNWWYWPGMLGGGLAATYGGYKLMDHLFNRRRKADTQSELEEARNQYRQSLLANYDPAHVHSAATMPKFASDQRVQKALDQLADKVEALNFGELQKSALWDWLKPSEGTVGGYMGMAALLGLPAAWMAYHATKARSPGKIMEEAIKARERDRWAARPPEVMIMPTPVRLNRQGDLEEEHKTASVRQRILKQITQPYSLFGR